MCQPGRGGQAEGRVLAQSALVYSVSDRGRSGGSRQITVIVEPRSHPTIVQYASSGEIAVAELPGSELTWR